jgi:hypothetical protein
MQSYHVHPERYRSPVADRPTTADGLIPHFLCNWPRVVIHHVDVSPVPRNEKTQRMVRVAIHLGALLPTDVRVAIVPTQHSVPGLSETRLSWKAEPFTSGGHRFEGVAPAVLLAHGKCAIRVTPTADLPAWRHILDPIEATCPDVKAASKRSAARGD